MKRIVALGNDAYVALVHPDLDQDTEEILADVLAFVQRTFCENK